MSLNRTYGTTRSADEGFLRRRMNDLVGLAAIFSTGLVVSLITGIDSPAFAVVLLGALGALAYGEQRMHDAAAPARPGTALSWNARA